MKRRSFVFCIAMILVLSLSCTAFAATETKIEKEMIYTTEDLVNVTTNGGQWTLEDGVFSLTKEPDVEARWYEAYLGEDDLTDFVVEFDLIQAIDGGIYFRLSNGENGLNTYMLGSDGLYMYFAKVDDGVFATMSAPEQKVPGGKNFAAQYNQMWDAHWKLVVKGNVFSAYVNGEEEPFIQATDSEFTQGCVGFNYSAPLEGEASMEITNFEVYKEIETTVEVPDETDPKPSGSEEAEPTDAPAATDPSEPAGENEPAPAPTGLIIGIGIAVIAIALGAVVAVKRKKS